MYNNRIYFRLLFVIAFVLSAVCMYAQEETMVIGQVLNSERQPLQGVNVTFKDSNVGMQTNDEGFFMLRTNQQVRVLQFSYLGYKKVEIKVKSGNYAGVEVIMEEQSTWLPEIFLLPDENPALELMKKVRRARSKNDLFANSEFKTKGQDKNAVFVTNILQRKTNKFIWERLKKGTVSDEDSSLIVPLFHSSENYMLQGDKRTEINRQLFETDNTTDRLAQQLLLMLNDNINFYRNTVVLFGRSFVSPLANVGNSYYKYILADSLSTTKGKQYEVHFRSVNKKNLAFDGKLWIDSATFSLTEIEAELPSQANINYVKNMHIRQKFDLLNIAKWTKSEEQLNLNMDYRLFRDSTRTYANLLLMRNSAYEPKTSDSLLQKNIQLDVYNDHVIAEKMNLLHNDPLYKAALWTADVILTGNAKIGKIDIGNIKDIVRITDIEGWRFALPLQTNEDLMKNVAIGGHIGYGFKNQTVKYSAFSKVRLGGHKKRMLKIGYFNDFRRIDYDYSDYSFCEATYPQNDEDIISTIVSLRSAKKMNERREFNMSFFNDWNENVESDFAIRSNEIMNSDWVPFIQNGNQVASIWQHSFVSSTRLSYNERTYEDHLRRFYIPSRYPVFYGIGEFGRYNAGDISGNYARLTAILKQSVLYEVGQWNYMARADWVIGSVPYPLLSYVHGNETSDYHMYKFNMIDYMNFAADRVFQMHNEFLFNGILLNRIPIIQNWNLREIISMKVGYGLLDKSKHEQVLSMPSYIHEFGKPYAEFGVGITNILRFFAVQSIWSMPNNEYTDKWNWKIQAYFLFSF